MINLPWAFGKVNPMGERIFPKCRAGLSNHLILGPLFWECPHPGIYLTLHKKNLTWKFSCLELLRMMVFVPKILFALPKFCKLMFSKFTLLFQSFYHNVAKFQMTWPNKSFIFSKWCSSQVSLNVFFWWKQDEKPMSGKAENTFSSRISPFEKPNRNKGTIKRPKDFFWWGGEGTNGTQR